MKLGNILLLAWIIMSIVVMLVYLPWRWHAKTVYMVSNDSGVELSSRLMRISSGDPYKCVDGSHLWSKGAAILMNGLVFKDSEGHLRQTEVPLMWLLFPMKSEYVFSLRAVQTGVADDMLDDAVCCLGKESMPVSECP